MTIIKNYFRKIIPAGWILKYHELQARFVNFIYGHPSRKMIMIGITGTNGKTTSCHFTVKILEKAGFKVGMITTTTVKIGKKEFLNKTKMTTLPAGKLQRFLREMQRNGCDYVVLEVSSHAIHQKRIFGVEFDIVAITNIEKEHIEYHGSFEKLLKTKQEIFKNLKTSFHKKHIPKIAVINHDEKFYKEFDKFEAERKYYFGILRGDIKAERINYEAEGSNFLLVTPLGNRRIDLKIPGRFNVYNSLTAAAIAISQAIDVKTIKLGLESLKHVPGRMEWIKTAKKLQHLQNFKVLVDYAHTPEALSMVLDILRQIKHNRIIIIFGSGGGKDVQKRPRLGKAADRGADIIILATEDAHHENQDKILDDIAIGIQNKKWKKTLFKILDRKKAIKKAFELAKEDDIVFLAGKGVEPAIVIGDTYHPWNEKKIARKLLEKKLKKINQIKG